MCAFSICVHVCVSVYVCMRVRNTTNIPIVANNMYEKK